MTMQHNPSYTVQPEKHLIGHAMEKENVSQREDGYGKIKLYLFC